MLLYIVPHKQSPGHSTWQRSLFIDVKKKEGKGEGRKGGKKVEMNIYKTTYISEACAKWFRCIILFIQSSLQSCEIGSHYCFTKEKTKALRGSVTYLSHTANKQLI